jgi:hypothetical protein
MSLFLRGSRCAAALLVAMPACSLLAAGPTAHTGQPLRPSQMMPARYGQLPPPDPASSAAAGAATNGATEVPEGSVVAPVPATPVPMNGAYPEGYQPYPGEYYGPHPMGGGQYGGYHGGYGPIGPDGCCEASDPRSHGKYAIDCAPCAENRCIPKFSWHVDWLYLHATGVDLAHAQQQDGIGGAGTVPFGDIGTLDPEFESGARIGFSAACSPCSGFTWSYTYFESGTETGPVDAFYDIDFQMSDLMYRTALSCSPCHSLNYMLGVQYGHLEQDFSQFGIFSGGQSGVIDTFSTIDFDGGGLKTGIEGERRLHGGLSIYGRLTGAVMSGQFSSRYTLLNSTTDVLLTQVNWKDDRVVSHVEYEIGFGWMNCSGHWRFATGYMFSHWMNAVTTPEFIDAVQADNYTNVDDTISFDGVVTRVEARW